MGEQGRAGTNAARARRVGELVATVVALAAAAVSPLLISVAAAGYGSLGDLARTWLLPSIAVLIALLIAGDALRWDRLPHGLIAGVWAGAVGTVGLEIVRVIGFRVFHSMPGSLPMLLGVLLTSRIMEGPNLLSDMLGWAYHFYNGAAFGIVYVLLLGKRSWWAGASYGLMVGIGFMVSPVVISQGIGYFGVQFGPSFAITVIAAHLAFGSLLGWLVTRTPASGTWLGAYILQTVGDTAVLHRRPSETEGDQ